MIRRAEEKDIDRIAEIYELIHDDEAAGRATVGWRRGVYPTRKTAAAAVAAGEMYVELCDGAITAAGIINQSQLKEYSDCRWKYPALDDEIMVLHTLVVDPKSKGRGQGAAFVKFYEEYALAQGCNYLRIDTQEKNTAARAFYKKLGFEETEIINCTFNGIPGVRLVCLEKKIR